MLKQTPTLRHTILFPKDSKLTGEEKPLSLIINSCFDANDSSTNFDSAKKLAESRGYYVLNKKKLIFDPWHRQIEDIESKIKPIISPNKSLTLWFEAHGAPCWLFGAGNPQDPNPANHPSHKSEKDATEQFYHYLTDIEKKIKLKINYILLNTCFSASELVNNLSQTYLNSSARLLSILMPNKKVLGFMGYNCSASVSHIWKLKQSQQREYEHIITDNKLVTECIVSLIEASIAFQDGKAIEYDDHALYCSKQNMQPYVLKCLEIEPDSTDFYKLGPAKEKVDGLRKQGLFAQSECFADKQIKSYEKSHTRSY